MRTKSHILIAEDDPHIRDGLIDMLLSEGYQATAAADGGEAVTCFTEESFDLVLLDVMMPVMNGYDVCREIRRQSAQVPILMLTAKSEEIDKVVGLQIGADDYITKPFGVHELLARVAAALRRARLATTKENKDKPADFSFGKVTVFPAKLECVIAGCTRPLTPRELKLLQLFFDHPGEALSRDFLLDEVWGVRYEGTTRTLDQHIAQLRKKIEDQPHQPEHILTVHGHGYRYQP